MDDDQDFKGFDDGDFDHGPGFMELGGIDSDHTDFGPFGLENYLAEQLPAEYSIHPEVYAELLEKATLKYFDLLQHEERTAACVQENEEAERWLLTCKQTDLQLLEKIAKGLSTLHETDLRSETMGCNDPYGWYWRSWYSKGSYEANKFWQKDHTETLHCLAKKLDNAIQLGDDLRELTGRIQEIVDVLSSCSITLVSRGSNPLEDSKFSSKRPDEYPDDIPF